MTLKHYKLEDFEILKVLGKGCLGKVFLVRHKSSCHYYALKSIHKRQQGVMIDLEKTILMRLPCHPFLISFVGTDMSSIGCFQSKSEVFYLLKYYPGGDLATQLSFQRTLPEERAKFYCCEMILALEKLHNHGIIYRDLKPENILIDEVGHIAITDFGLAKHMSDRPFYEDPGSSNVTKTFCGTAEYLAPEIITSQPYDYRVDWFALGTVFYEMIYGITPFWHPDKLTMFKNIVRMPLSFPDFCIGHRKDLIMGLLERNPSQRYDICQIKNHPYFGDVDWNRFMAKQINPPFIPQLVTASLIVGICR